MALSGYDLSETADALGDSVFRTRQLKSYESAQTGKRPIDSVRQPLLLDVCGSFPWPKAFQQESDWGQAPVAHRGFLKGNPRTTPNVAVPGGQEQRFCLSSGLVI